MRGGGGEDGGREGGRQRSIYADNLRRSSADPVVMRDETAEVLDKEERNESKVQRSGQLLNTQRTTEIEGGWEISQIQMRVLASEWINI